VALLLGAAALAAAEPEDPGDPILEHALLPWTGDLDGMVERGMIRVAMPQGLLTLFLDGVDAKGATYELVREFEQHLKAELGGAGARLGVVVVPAARHRLLDMLAEGRADLAAGNLTITPARLERVDFSAPFRTDVRELLVTGPAAPPVATAEDMVGTPVHVRRSSSFFEHLTALNERRRAAGRPAFTIAEADENLQSEDLIEMVGAGLIPATIVDSPVAELFAQVFDGVTVHQDLVLAEDQAIGWAMRKDSPELKAAVDGFVAKARKGTLLGNVILKKYTSDTEWIGNALDATGRARFTEIVEHLRTYAGRYDFDWLLVGAQGYQESRLDQSKRSPVGAVGVMQVMPATARDPNVGIPDIEELEPNIHAGVKYLRFLRDHYFSDPALSPLDQQLFAFAAYNAGPGNIAKARTRAAKMGLDPNVWFDNVEIAAGKVVSREPVVYVRNIFKYHVAYKLMVGQG
jgi:membrane-bound lytic murein transglycosylase MltF